MLQGFNAREIAITLRAMAETGTQRPDVFEVLCTAAAQKLQDFIAREILRFYQFFV